MFLCQLGAPIDFLSLLFTPIPRPLLNHGIPKHNQVSYIQCRVPVGVDADEQEDQLGRSQYLVVCSYWLLWCSSPRHWYGIYAHWSYQEAKWYVSCLSGEEKVVLMEE